MTEPRKKRPVRKVVLTGPEREYADRAGLTPERYAALRDVKTLEDYRRLVDKHGPGRGW